MPHENTTTLNPEDRSPLADASADLFGNVPQHAEQVGSFPQSSEPFRNVPHRSESDGTIPNHSESLRSIPQAAVRKTTHTLTVREVARLFETAGVARTERSITNWCVPNRTGIARLDGYFDPNERKYFITPQSVNRAIEEEQAKAARENPPSPESPTPEIPNPAESAPPPKASTADTADSTDDVRELRQENFDLKITNRAKDMFIQQLQSERAAFATERQTYVEKLMTFNHRLGELETRLLQPSQGESNPARRPVVTTSTAATPNPGSGSGFFDSQT